MNNDAAHCADYVIGVCPKDCYRAKLTQEYYENRNRITFVTWAHLEGKAGCKKKRGDGMTIKGEICQTVKVEARLLGDGTLWIKTDKDSLEKVNRVIVEDGKMWCKQFYQDAQPEIIYCKDCVHNIEPEFGFCDRANHHVSLNSYCANVFHAERRETE